MSGKSKVLSIRISPDEYRRLRAACAVRGSQNISELIRAIMQRLIDGNASQASIDEQLEELRMRVHALSVDIDRLDGLRKGENGSQEAPVLDPLELMKR